MVRENKDEYRKLTDNCYLDPNKLSITVSYQHDGQFSKSKFYNLADIQQRIIPGVCYDIIIELPVVSHGLVKKANEGSEIDLTAGLSGSTRDSSQKKKKKKKKKEKSRT